MLRDSRAKVHSDNHILQLKLDASRREHSSLEDELRKTEEQLRTVQAEVEALQSNHVLEAQVDALQKEIAKSQRKHAAANTEVQRLLGVQFTERNKSRENEAKIEGLIQENERLSRELHSQKTDADTERSKGRRKQNEADMTIKQLKLELVQHKALLQQRQSKPLQGQIHSQLWLSRFTDCCSHQLPMATLVRSAAKGRSLLKSPLNPSHRRTNNLQLNDDSWYQLLLNPPSQPL